MQGEPEIDTQKVGVQLETILKSAQDHACLLALHELENCCLNCNLTTLNETDDKRQSEASAVTSSQQRFQGL